MLLFTFNKFNNDTHNKLNNDSTITTILLLLLLDSLLFKFKCVKPS